MFSQVLILGFQIQRENHHQSRLHEKNRNEKAFSPMCCRNKSTKLWQKNKKNKIRRIVTHGILAEKDSFEMLCLKIQCFKNENSQRQNDLQIPRAGQLFVWQLKHFGFCVYQILPLLIQRLPQHEIQSVHKSLATMNRYSKSQ